MELPIRTARIAAGVTFVVAAVLVLAGIWSFGIWDPWELASADVARRLAAGEPPTDRGTLDVPPLGPWLVAQGFSIFGIHEWSGRVPIAISALAAVAIGYWLVARFAGRRAGIYAALIACTSPLFLFNARQMIGAGPAFAAQAAVFLCAASLLFQPERAESATLRAPVARALWGVGLLASIALSTLASGVLLGVLPALGAIAATAIARGELAPERLRASGEARVRAGIAWAVVVGSALVAIHVARLVAIDADVYSAWIGGIPRGGNPPTFERVLELVFHSFAPWSALLPIAIGRAMAGRAEGEALVPATFAEEPSLRIGLVLWAAFGFCAQTIYVSRFGSATFLPVIALAGSVALLLRDVERAGRGSWAAGLVTLLLSALLLRDFRGYPVSPASGLGIDGLALPEDFPRSSGWVALLALFGVTAMLGLGVDREEAVRFRDPRPLFRTQWQRGPGFRAWMIFFLLVLAACTVFGLECFLVGDDRPYEALLTVAAVTGGLGGAAWLGVIGVAVAYGLATSDDKRAGLGRIVLGLAIAAVLLTSIAIANVILGQPQVSSLAVRIGRVLAFIAPAIALLVAIVLGGRAAFHLMGEWSLAPMLLVGVVIGGYTSFIFQPKMSSHFSPREVYDAYNDLASQGEPLGEYRVGGRAAAYYAHGEVEELTEQNAVLEFLGRPERVWLAFRADDLAQLDRAYRQRTNRHLFVADASSTRVLLATNQPPEGLASENYLADAILDEVPQVQHRVGANFDRRVELVGYDLDLPGGHSVGPGQQFTVTWYWRVMAPVPGSYQIFLHVDGAGQRLNGDHEPVDGHYPVRLWDEGDIVVDRQTLRVPANFPPGQYTFFIGFYAGESRLDVVEGPTDEVDRARAGTLLVR
ncbi:ArnT family glycosyltransferase [Sandaracinus amylolyticus]|nr:glycosyltransferase family 39 protein [Sandaracinus amylolyticus]